MVNIDTDLAKIVVDLVALLISLCALVLSVMAFERNRAVFKWNQTMSTLEADNNIIGYVTAILSLLERLDDLGDEERRLMKQLLKDIEFFEPSKVGDLRPYFIKTDAEEDLQQHFAP